MENFSQRFEIDHCFPSSIILYYHHLPSLHYYRDLESYFLLNFTSCQDIHQEIFHELYYNCVSEQLVGLEGRFEHSLDMLP